MNLIMSMKPKHDPRKVCINCGGAMEQVSTRYDLRAQAAITIHSCTACRHSLTAFRRMTAKELAAETARAKREAERLEAERLAKAEREERERLEREAEIARIIAERRRLGK